PASVAESCPRAARTHIKSSVAVAKSRLANVAFGISLCLPRCGKSRGAVFTQIHGPRHLIALEGPLVFVMQRGSFNPAAARELDLVPVDMSFDGTFHKPSGILPRNDVPLGVEIE